MLGVRRIIFGRRCGLFIDGRLVCKRRGAMRERLNCLKDERQSWPLTTHQKALSEHHSAVGPVHLLL
jgi:hypothetical protein